MKILVAVKRVIDAYVNIRVKADQTGVETANVKMSMNPFDEIAVEEAVRLKEKNIVDEIIVVSIGDKTCQETLRTALALGCDKAILVEENLPVPPITVAKTLQAIIKEEHPDLVILGKQAIDADNNQTGQMLAGLLNWSQGTFISEVNIADGKALVMREIDGGLETLSLTLPCVLTTDLRLNEPRYASLPNIMKAKRKPLTTKTLQELGVELNQGVTVLKFAPPPARQAGIKVESVEQLVDKLVNEARVIE